MQIVDSFSRGRTVLDATLPASIVSSQKKCVGTNVPMGQCVGKGMAVKRLKTKKKRALKDSKWVSFLQLSDTARLRAKLLGAVLEMSVADRRCCSCAACHVS